MTKYTGDERREGSRDRRHAPTWVLWVALVGAGIIPLAAIGGYAVGDTPDPEPIVIPDNMPELREIITRLDTLGAREPEVRTLVTTRIVRDTVRIPYAVEPEIVRVHDTTQVLVFRVDTIYMPPQIITIPAPVRTFWSSDSYRPSIGNTVWSFGGFVIGAILGGALENSASACVVVNSEETCSHN